MPQIFRIGAFVVYFWSNENNPIEPVHVHVSAEPFPMQPSYGLQARERR